MAANIQELGSRLTQIIEQRKLRAKLTDDLSSVEKDLQEKSALLESLRAKLDKEKIDVEKLERTGLTALFYSVLGSREQQLEKERQELLAAQLLFQQKQYEVSYLQQDQIELSQKLDALWGVDWDYQSLLVEKEAALRQSNQVIAGELMEISEAEANANSDSKEMAEAIWAGNNTVSALDKMIESLESAENWGTWDMLGGGFLSKAVKHSRIDDARSDMNEVQSRMSRFKRELADVRKSVQLEMDISQLDTFADFFFDGLITDWIVQSKIIHALDQARRAKTLIENTLAKIEARKHAADDEVKALQEKRMQLIANS